MKLLLCLLALVVCIDAHMIPKNHPVYRKKFSGHTHAKLVKEASAPVAPVWPNAFISNWTMYSTYNRNEFPPFVNGIPQPPYQAARGAVYYDWNPPARKYLREDYFDFCIPIFALPSGNNFPCSFIDVGAVSYMITYGAPLRAPECCIFLKPWNAPAPDFIRSSSGPWAATYNFSSWMNDQIVDHYTVGHPELQGGAGPFGYAFYRQSQLPAAFYFGGLMDTWTAGMCTQNYFNWRAEMPPESTWNLPASCSTADYCPDWLWPSAGTSANLTGNIPYGVEYHCPDCGLQTPPAAAARGKADDKKKEL